MENTKRIFVGLLVVAVAQVIIYYPQLPDVVASHFDGSGHPNGWMSKTAFFALDLAMILVIAASFLWVPRALGRFPVYLWSLPNRDYWFAPERRDESLRLIHSWLLVFGVATIVLMLVAFQCAIMANLQPPPTLSPVMIVSLVGYFVFTAVWLAVFYRRFSSIPHH